MNKPTAIIDKSLLQRICNPRAKTDIYINHLREKYSLVAPLILIEEILDNLTRPPKRKPRAVFPAMVKRLQEIHPQWMEDVSEISYGELVLSEGLDSIPWLSEEHQRMIGDFRPDDAKSIAWVPERRRSREEQIQKRKQWQNKKIAPGKFFIERDEKTFFQMLTNLFLRELSRSISKTEILHTLLGSVFVKRHPENETDIRAALERINDSNINGYNFSRNYLISSLVYLIGPITKVLAKPSGRQQPLKILDRQDQLKNSEDQEYVASAFLCGRLLTGDEKMAKVMRMFESNGLWPGQTIWIDRSKDLSGQIPTLLV